MLGDEHSQLYDVFVSFFANGYGGSHLRDYMMGVSPGLFASNTVAKGWVAAFCAVYYAPGNAVFKVSAGDTADIHT